MGAVQAVEDDFATPPTITGDQRAFLSELVDGGRFCRDTRLGGMFHRGAVSLREVSDGDSLHLSIVDGGTVSVHVDHFSPVAGTRPNGCCQYSVRAVVAHLFAYLSAQTRQLVRGARGAHRCRLECELVTVDGEVVLTDEDSCACPEGDGGTLPKPGDEGSANVAPHLVRRETPDSGA